MSANLVMNNSWTVLQRIIQIRIDLFKTSCCFRNDFVHILCASQESENARKSRPENTTCTEFQPHSHGEIAPPSRWNSATEQLDNRTNNRYYTATSAFIHVCLIIPDRKATICFSFMFALHRIYGWPNTESTAIRFYPDGKFGMNHIFGFGLFDIPKTLHSTLHQDSIQLIIMRLKSGLNPVGTGDSVPQL